MTQIAEPITRKFHDIRREIHHLATARWRDSRTRTISQAANGLFFAGGALLGDRPRFDPEFGCAAQMRLLVVITPASGLLPVRLILERDGYGPSPWVSL